MFGKGEKIFIEKAFEGHLVVCNNLLLNVSDSYINSSFCDYSPNYVLNFYLFG